MFMKTCVSGLSCECTLPVQQCLWSIESGEKVESSVLYLEIGFVRICSLESLISICSFRARRASRAFELGLRVVNIRMSAIINFQHFQL